AAAARGGTADDIRVVGSEDRLGATPARGRSHSAWDPVRVHRAGAVEGNAVRVDAADANTHHATGAVSCVAADVAIRILGAQAAESTGAANGLVRVAVHQALAIDAFATGGAAHAAGALVVLIAAGIVRQLGQAVAVTAVGAGDAVGIAHAGLLALGCAGADERIPARSAGRATGASPDRGSVAVLRDPQGVSALRLSARSLVRHRHLVGARELAH